MAVNTNFNPKETEINYYKLPDGTHRIEFNLAWGDAVPWRFDSKTKEGARRAYAQADRMRRALLASSEDDVDLEPRLPRVELPAPKKWEER